MEEREIRQLREGLALSQERFARLLGVSLQTVRRWEEGVSRPLPVMVIRLQALRRRSGLGAKGGGGMPRKRPMAEVEIGLGGLFKGIGNLLDLVSQMAEEGKEEFSRTGEIKGLGDKLKGVYGLSVRVGLGGRPVIESFGNIKSTPRGSEVAEVREPLVDLLDEGGQLRVLAEVPGVEASDIKVEVQGDILTLSAQGKDRKYYKEVLLPWPVVAEEMEWAYQNGVLEIKLSKKT